MPALLGWLIEIAGTLVGKVLLSLGISYLSYKGLDLMITAGKAQFMQNASALGPTVVGLLGVMKIDVAVNMLCSALIGRLTLSGLTGGSLKKMVLK